jgi:hypothetical protein
VRRQAQWRDTGAAGQFIRPGAGRVDDHVGRDVQLRRAYLPATACAGEGCDFLRERNTGAARAGTAQESLQQQLDIDVSCRRVEQGPIEAPGAQQRHQRARLLR